MENRRTFRDEITPVQHYCDVCGEELGKTVINLNYAMMHPECFNKEYNKTKLYIDEIKQLKQEKAHMTTTINDLRYKIREMEKFYKDKLKEM